MTFQDATVRMTLTLFVALIFTQTPARAAQRRVPDKPQSARWLGQDNNDLVGPRSAPGPSDVQDVHIKLEGLSVEREVRSLVIRGEGGDEWQYNGKYGPYRAELVRKLRESQADLYIEPTRAETGRGFTITIEYELGPSQEIQFRGGRADPNLRMPQAKLNVRWLGQAGADRAGLGPGVGPDGFQDAAITLERLSTGVELREIVVTGHDGATWRTGVNAAGNHAAWFQKDPSDPTRGTLFFQPVSAWKKENLKIQVLYGNEKTDFASVEADSVKPDTPASRPEARNLAKLELESSWSQPSGDSATRGLVELRLKGLPLKRVQAAALSNPAGEAWLFLGDRANGFEVASYPLPLLWQSGPDRSQATLKFPPVRDETDSKLDLRIRFEDGDESIAIIQGGSADVSLRSAPAQGADRVARPGDDLSKLLEASGHIHLSKGTYKLNEPLVLERAVKIDADPGATLEFSQAANSPPWTAAIKIHAGQTTLDGLQIRFRGPVRWDRDVSYGPAVIGTTDNRDSARTDARAGLVIRNLNIDCPLPSSDWEEAPRSLRLVTATSGLIQNNTIRGGAIELTGGPWKIEGNTHLGTPPGTYAFSVISAHHTHDLQVIANKTYAAGVSGKTWRFLVLTVGGWKDDIRENTILDVGPRDTDIHSENAPEIILTESYRLRFEGTPRALSTDRRVLVIPDPQGDSGEPGDMLAILAGKHAGQFRRVSQRIDRTTYLLDTPLPPVEEIPVISLSAQGFTRTRFQGNSIDARGSAQAAGFVLAGNHHGTRVVENTVRGCGDAFRIISFPTEQPGPWGWSHMPMFGIDVRGNRIEGAERGMTLAVEHGPPIASNRGRVYYSGWLRDNVIAHDTNSSKLAQFVIGDSRTLDKNELVLSLGNNRLEGGRPDAEPVRIESGVTYPLKNEQTKR